MQQTESVMPFRAPNLLTSSAK